MFSQHPIIPISKCISLSCFRDLQQSPPCYFQVHFFKWSKWELREHLHLLLGDRAASWHSGLVALSPPIWSVTWTISLSLLISEMGLTIPIIHHSVIRKIKWTKFSNFSWWVVGIDQTWYHFPCSRKIMCD